MSLVEESGRVVPSTNSGYSFGSCNALHKKDVTDASEVLHYQMLRMFGVNLQCAVDDALDLVHDVMLGEQMLEIPDQDFLPICFFQKKRNLLAGSPGKAMVARQ